MGQEGWWSFLKAVGFEPPPYDLALLQDDYMDIDTLSTFFGAINTQVLKMKSKGKSAREAGVVLAHLFASLSPQSQTTLHIDGATSQRKQDEHDRRRA